MRADAGIDTQTTACCAELTGNGLLFCLFLTPHLEQTPQADKPATPPSGYTRGLFESEVSVSRLVSWHFRGLGRRCHSCFGVEGIHTLARPNQRTFIVHIRTAIR
jgi:hypothetical protein